MKHLLIILSLLLLSFPLFGQETGVLFLHLETGETVYSEEGDDDNDGKYVGEIQNGVPNGQGTESSPYGEKYEGEFKDGVRHGQGTSTLPDGQKYVLFLTEQITLQNNFVEHILCNYFLTI